MGHRMHGSPEPSLLRGQDPEPQDMWRSGAMVDVVTLEPTLTGRQEAGSGAARHVVA
jgi:hypothetical protein